MIGLMAGAVDFVVSYTSPDRPWAEWIAWELEPPRAALGRGVVAQACGEDRAGSDSANPRQLCAYALGCGVSG